MNRIVELIRRTKRASRTLRFQRGSGYNAEAFWEWRHAKYNSDFRAVANTSENASDRYEKQRTQFLEFLDNAEINFTGLGCIEFGCGNGFWGKVVLENGARWYQGLEISKTAVRNCRKAVPEGIFERVNLSEEDYRPEKQADLVFSIDVLQHIVEEDKRRTFLKNMVACVRPKGYILVTSYTGYGSRFADPEEKEAIAGFVKLPKLRWVYLWEMSTLKKHLEGCTLERTATFWDKSILGFVRDGIPDVNRSL